MTKRNTNPLCPILTLAYLLMSSISGCAPRQPGINHGTESAVCFIGSPEYDDKLEKFTITPAEATRRVRDFAQRHKSVYAGKGYWTVQHLVTVEDSYLFSRPNKMKVSLSGFLVDGYTGEVQFLDRDEEVSFADSAPVMPTDGDESLLSVTLE